MSLVTVSQVKDYLPHIPSTGTSEDSLLTTLITRAEAAIARYLGYPPASVGGSPSMSSTSYTLYVRARTPEARPGWRDEEPVYRTLRLPVRPVTAIASIYADPDESYGSDTLVDSGDYTLDGDVGEVRLKSSSTQGSWYPQKRAQKVTCTAGFATAPYDLVEAICLTVAASHKRRPNTGVERSSTADGASIEFEKVHIPARARELLAEFVLPSSTWGD